MPVQTASEIPNPNQLIFTRNAATLTTDAINNQPICKPNVMAENHCPGCLTVLILFRQAVKANKYTKINIVEIPTHSNENVTIQIILIISDIQ